MRAAALNGENAMNKEFCNVGYGSSEKEIRAAYLQTMRERFAMDDYQARRMYEKHKDWTAYLVDTIHGRA